MSKIRKDDTVIVLTGKDKGKSGKALSVIPKKGRVLVQGINFIKKHTRRTKEDQQGGIVQKESSINISNLMVVCQKCGKPTRIGFTILSDGSKARVCKKCKELI
ncbi:MAG: 50S ribosomal protein L24 [Candidatus Omnitrophota bacterium]